MGVQMDIRDILGEIQNDKQLFTERNHKDRVGELLRHFQQGGLTLEKCADARHLDRAMSTLKGYARELNLAFPDYIPMHMREKKKKASAA